MLADWLIVLRLCLCLCFKHLKNENHFFKLYPNLIITTENFLFCFKSNMLSILVQVSQCSHNVHTCSALTVLIQSLQDGKRPAEIMQPTKILCPLTYRLYDLIVDYYVWMICFYYEDARERKSIISLINQTPPLNLRLITETESTIPTQNFLFKI